MKMKKLFLLPLLALCGHAMAQSTVEFKLSDKQCDSLVLYVYDDAFMKVERQLRVAAPEGKVTVELPEKTVRMVRVTTPQAMATNDRTKVLNLFSIPGVTAKVSGSWKSYKVKGHQLLTDSRKFEKEVNKLRAIDNTLLMNMHNDGVQRETMMNYYREIAAELERKMQAMAMEFINEHPDRDFSAYLAVTPVIRNTDEILPKLTPEVQNGIMKSHVNAVLAARKQAMDAKMRRAQNR